MDKKTYNKFMQVWRMLFGSNKPLNREEMDFVCEQSNVSFDNAMMILDDSFGILSFDIDKITNLGFE